MAGISTRNTWNIDNNRSSNGPSDSLINWTVSGRMLIAVHQSLKRDFVKVVTRFSVSLWPLLRVLLSIFYAFFERTRNVSQEYFI